MLITIFEIIRQSPDIQQPSRNRRFEIRSVRSTRKQTSRSPVGLFSNGQDGNYKLEIFTMRKPTLG